MRSIGRLGQPAAPRRMRDPVLRRRRGPRPGRPIRARGRLPGPNATSAFEAAKEGKTRLVGTFSGGWPQLEEIAVATRNGSGLVVAITAALNGAIDSGAYARTLARWSLESEAVAKSATNPAGLPQS